MTKHKAVLTGKVYRKLYSFSKWDGVRLNTEPKITTPVEFVENKVLWSGELEFAKVSKGDSIFIQELNKEVEILSYTLSTDGSIRYNTNHIFELIEDEKTEESLTNAKRIEEEVAKRRKVLKPQKTILEELNIVEDKKWFELEYI